jgi:hypothetical protein
MEDGVGDKSERSKKPEFGKRAPVAEIERKPGLLERLRAAVSGRWSRKKGAQKAKHARGKSARSGK